MTAPRIEHVNVTVSDPERAAALMQSVFGWKVRWSGPARDGGRTLHVGSDQHYVALYTGRDIAYTDDDFAKGRPLNHIGVEVEDLDATEARVIAAGLLPFNHGDYEPGRGSISWIRTGSNTRSSAMSARRQATRVRRWSRSDRAVGARLA